MAYDNLEPEKPVQAISPYVWDEEGAQEGQVTCSGTP